MANNPQYIKDLARQSGKSESAVSTAIDNSEKQLSNSPQKKAYDNAKDNDRDKKYQEYWGAVMLKVRTLLGMPNPKINIPEGIDNKITTWADFYWINDRGSIDDNISAKDREKFENEFNEQFGELPVEIDRDEFDVQYKMTREQFDWCYKNYPQHFVDKIVEEVGGVTTANMGSPTLATGENAPHGSSAIFASRMGMTSRGGDIKKKKKKIRESIEYIDSIIN